MGVQNPQARNGNINTAFGARLDLGESRNYI